MTAAGLDGRPSASDWLPAAPAPEAEAPSLLEGTATPAGETSPSGRPPADSWAPGATPASPSGSPTTAPASANTSEPRVQAFSGDGTAYGTGAVANGTGFACSFRSLPPFARVAYAAMWVPVFSLFWDGGHRAGAAWNCLVLGTAQLISTPPILTPQQPAAMGSGEQLRAVRCCEMRGVRVQGRGDGGHDCGPGAPPRPPCAFVRASPLIQDPLIPLALSSSDLP